MKDFNNFYGKLFGSTASPKIRTFQDVLKEIHHLLKGHCRTFQDIGKNQDISGQIRTVATMIQQQVMWFTVFLLNLQTTPRVYRKSIMMFKLSSYRERP